MINTGLRMRIPFRADAPEPYTLKPKTLNANLKPRLSNILGGIKFCHGLAIYIGLIFRVCNSPAKYAQKVAGPLRGLIADLHQFVAKQVGGLVAGPWHGNSIQRAQTDMDTKSQSDLLKNAVLY